VLVLSELAAGGGAIQRLAWQATLARGAVVGGLSEGAQLQAIRKGARFVVATPGRLEDYLDRRLFHFNACASWSSTRPTGCSIWVFLPRFAESFLSFPRAPDMCFSATMEGSMVRVVNDYMKAPVRLSFGSTLKPHENVRVQAFEVAMDRKMELLPAFACEGNRTLPYFRAHQARNGSYRREPQSQGLLRGHDSTATAHSRNAPPL